MSSTGGRLSHANATYCMFRWMLQGRPLYDNPADAKYYVLPPEWDAVVRALERGNNTMICGERGAGKTSLLRQVQLRLRNRDERVVYVDATAVAEPLELVFRVRDAVKGRPGIAQTGAGTVSRTLAQMAGDQSPPPGGASRLLYDTLLSLGEEVEPTIVLLDATAAAQAVYGVFGRMRDMIWQLPHRWLVAIDNDDRATALRPPADTFFDTVIELRPLSIERLTMILLNRTDELPQKLLSQVAADARGNPRAAIRAANNALVHGADPVDELSSRARLLHAAAQLGRPQGMLMAELLDLGQASPSDEALLDRLGLTRARVSTLLQQLLAADLVESTVERSDGPGRPRTVYRPALRGGT
jgi:DNA-binding MarR family transcriptional regulator